MKTITCILFLSLCGCAEFSTEIIPMSEGRNYAYGVGLDDGCYTAKGTAHKIAVQNEVAYKHVTSYREGWDEGFDFCKKISSQK